MSAPTTAERLELNRQGFWEIRWTEPGTGRTRTYSTHQKERGVAEAILHARRAHRAAASQPVVNVATVGGILDAYSAAAKGRGVNPSQLRMVETLRPYFGGFAPGEITPAVVTAYRTWRSGLSNNTLRRELGALATALTWAGRHRLLAAVPLVDLPKAGPPKAAFLRHEDEAELWALASCHTTADGRLSRVARFVCIGLETGARKAAIEGLTWDRVDLRYGMIDFRDPTLAVNKKRRVATVITDRLRPVLERALRERRPRDRYVLDIGGEIREAWNTAMTRWGFAGTTPHVLRHTRITLLLQAGVSLWDVSGLVGTSPNMIQSVYGHHVTDARLKGQANRRFGANPTP